MHAGVGGFLPEKLQTPGVLQVLKEVYTTLGPSPGMTLEKEVSAMRPPAAGPPATDGQMSARHSAGGSDSARSKRERKKPPISSTASVSSNGSLSPPTTRRRKRRRAAAMKTDSYQEDSDLEDLLDDDDLARLQLPDEYEQEFVSAVFNIGLKTSSPKVLMDLMPVTDILTTEHIKSHLQKYRLHHQRSKEEFMEFYDSFLRNRFIEYCEARGWETHRRADSDEESEDGEPEEYRKMPAIRRGGEQQQLPLESVGPMLTADERAHHLKSVQDLSSRLLQEQLNLQSSIQTFIQTNIQLQNGMLKQLHSITSAAPSLLDDPTHLLLELSAAPVATFLTAPAPMDHTQPEHHHHHQPFDQPQGGDMHQQQHFDMQPSTAHQQQHSSACGMPASASAYDPMLDHQEQQPPPQPPPPPAIAAEGAPMF